VRRLTTSTVSISGRSETPRRSASARVIWRTWHLQPHPLGGIQTAQKGSSTGRTRPSFAAWSGLCRSDGPSW